MASHLHEAVDRRLSSLALPSRASPEPHQTPPRSRLWTLIDLSRSTSQLVAANTLLRKPLIILRRQVKRPACTKTDRMLLVLLARMVRTWKQALVLNEDDHEAREGLARVFKLFWQYKSMAAALKPRISEEIISLIGGDGKG